MSTRCIRFCLSVDGLRLVRAGLSRAPFAAPFAGLQVPPKYFLQDGINDMTRAALDETCVALDNSFTGCSSLTSLAIISGGSWTIGIVFLLSRLLVWSEKFFTVETPGTTLRAGWRA